MTCVARYDKYSVTSIIRTSFIRLFKLAEHQKIHYHACPEDVTNGLCGCGYMLSVELWALQALPCPKLITSDLS